MKKWADIANKILFYGFLLMGILLLFFDRGRLSTVIFSFASFAVSWAFSLFFKARNIPKGYTLLVNVGLWLNLLGEFVFYYTGITYYDKILHISMGILITAITFEYFLRNLKVRKEAIFFSVLGMLCLWEIYEYFLVIFFNFPAMGVFNEGVVIQSALDDTMMDLVWGSIGSLLFLIIKKKDRDRVEKTLR